MTNLYYQDCNGADFRVDRGMIREYVATDLSFEDLTEAEIYGMFDSDENMTAAFEKMKQAAVERFIENFYGRGSSAGDFDQLISCI